MHMRKRNSFYILFVTGTVLLVLSTIMGLLLDDEIKATDLKAFQASQGVVGNIRFFSFALFFPTGVLCLFLAGILLSHKQKIRLLYMLLTMSVLIVFMVSWPAVVGREHVPAYFGVGGIVMLILIVLVAWQWSHYRHHVHHDMRRALDFKALGYFCFALAAWNTCGTLGLPGYGIYPEQMQQHFNQEFVVGQAKVVMLYFVMAWLFTLIGMRIAAKVSRAA